jgi:hypothetical protein
MHQRTVGTRERLNPSYYVDDDSPRLQTLGEYQQSGRPSIAARELDGWRSVFCGEPILTLDLLRGLCRFAGAHLYTPIGEDYLFAGDGWLTLHTVREGQKTIFLPSPLAVFDLTEGKYLGDDMREVRFFAKARTTQRWCVGTMDVLRKLGLPGIEKPSRARRGRNARVDEPATSIEIVPNLESAADELPASDTDLPASPIAESEDRLEAEEIGEDGPNAVEGQAGENNGNGTESDQERRHRRRRRGGRGRGRRGRGSTAAGAPADEAPSS